jgi:hypothetical protein
MSIRYDDYKFVTRDEVDKLGISGLIGTPMLRAYMHGFFMDAKLHREAKTLSEPFAYEECVIAHSPHALCSSLPGGGSGVVEPVGAAVGFGGLEHGMARLAEWAMW